MCHSIPITAMRLTSIKKMLGALSLRQLRQLDLAIHKLIQIAEKRETDRSDEDLDSHLSIIVSITPPLAHAHL